MWESSGFRTNTMTFHPPRPDIRWLCRTDPAAEYSGYRLTDARTNTFPSPVQMPDHSSCPYIQHSLTSQHSARPDPGNPSPSLHCTGKADVPVPRIAFGKSYPYTSHSPLAVLSPFVLPMSVPSVQLLVSSSSSYPPVLIVPEKKDRLLPPHLSLNALCSKWLIGYKSIEFIEMI